MEEEVEDEKEEKKSVLIFHQRRNKSRWGI